MIAAQADAGQFLAAPDLFSVAWVKGIHAHVFAADVNGIPLGVESRAAQKRTASRASPFHFATARVGRVELSVAAPDHEQIVVYRGRIPDGCAGLDGPSQSSICSSDCVNPAIRCTEKDARLPFIASAHRDGMEDSTPCFEGPNVSAGLGIDGVQHARQCAGENLSIGDDRLHAGHQTFIGKQPIPLAFKGWANFSGCGSAPAGIMGQHGPVVIRRSRRGPPRQRKQ